MFDQNGLKSFCNERNLQVAPGGIGCLQYGHSLSAWFKTSSGSDFIGSSLTLHYWLLLLQLRAEMFYVLATVTCLRRHAVSLSLTLSLVSFSPLLLLLLSVSLSHHLTFTLSHFCWNFFLPFSSLDFFFWKLTFVCFFFLFHSHDISKAQQKSHHDQRWSKIPTSDRGMFYIQCVGVKNWDTSLLDSRDAQLPLNSGQKILTCYWLKLTSMTSWFKISCLSQSGHLPSHT